MAKRIKVSYSAAPRVDLLPDRHRAEMQHEATLPKLLLAIVASAAIAGLIYAAGMVPGYFAQQKLSLLNAESERLSAEIATYDEAQQLLQAVGSRESDRQTVTAEEVLFMELRNQIAVNLAPGSSLIGFLGELPIVEEGATAETTADLEGCAATGAAVTITVSTPGADGLAAAAVLLDGVRNIPGFLCGSVLSSTVTITEDTATTETELQLSFDESVRAGRFAEEEAQ